MSRSFALLVTLAAWAGSSAAPVPTHLMPKDPPFVHPTCVGTKWVYECNGVEEIIVISEVKQEKDGSKLVTTESVGADGMRSPHQVTLFSAAGVFLVAAGGPKYDEPRCLLKLPHRPGQTWKFKTGGEGWTLTAGPVEKVKVPAGESSAARVGLELKLTDRVLGEMTLKTTLWYVNGVGLVRMGEHTKLKSFMPGKD